MFCSKCGTQLDDDSRFCYLCGTPTGVDEQSDKVTDSEHVSDEPPAAPTPATPAPQSQSQSPVAKKFDDNLFPILGFILAFFVPIAGLVLSIIGMVKKKHPNLATAGMILGILFTILYTIIIVVVVENNTPRNYYF